MVTKGTTNREQVISLELASSLEEYLAFRHFSRNATLFVLEWDKMAPLALGCETVLEDLGKQIEIFLSR